MSTLGDLRDEVAEEIGSINTTDDVTKIDRFLNRAVRDFLSKTGIYVTEATTLETADSGDYTLDTAIMLIKNIYVTSGTVDYPLEQVSPQQILDWRLASSSSTSPSRYYALNGANMLMVYPTPSGNDTVTLYYVAVPTEMSSTSHDPSDATYGGVPVLFHDALALYAMWKLASFDDDQSSAQGQRYRDDYRDRIKEARKYVSMKGNTVAPRARVGGRRRGLRLHDNSADW